MTLNTTDYLEYYLTLVGWIVSNGIWNILVASGVFALPFVVMVVQEWLRARAEGADEGNKGVLSSMRIENRVWVAIVVILFAGIPFIPVDLSTIKFDTTRSAQCQVSVPQPTDTGWSNAYTTLNNQSALVPVWWFFMHAISKAVTGGAVAAIPCGTDLRQMRMDVDATRIDDPVLAQEVGDFVHDCYGPSRAKLFMSRPTLSDEQMNDVTWIGSSYFLNNAGFYDTYHSNTPRTAWPYDATRDAGLAQVDSGGGYPTCRQWWSDGGSGLRARLLAQDGVGQAAVLVRETVAGPQLVGYFTAEAGEEGEAGPLAPSARARQERVPRLAQGRLDECGRSGQVRGELIGHADAGSQYTSITFTDHLAEEGILPSIGSVADAYDNALMECVIGLYKTECIRTTIFHDSPYKTIADVEYATAGWVDWYNNRRLHSRLAMVSPLEFEQSHYAALNPEPQPA